MKASKPFNFHSTLIGVATATFTLFAPLASADTETYNTAGTFNWVCPGGVTSIQVECWGGGGAGGAGRKDTTAGTNTSQNGGGGGGGAYARRVAVPVTAGTTYTITIPGAAVSGSAGTTTNGAGRVNGGAVTFVGDGGVTVTAAGGQGGANAYTTVNGTTGAGGGVGATTAASLGDVSFAGGAGSTGNTGATNVSGSGGGGAGDANAGGAAVTTASTTTAGAGGVAGGGAGGAGRSGGNTNPGAGAPGATPGGGGGGGHNQGISTRLGGTGGLGQITLTYTIPPNFKANNETALNDPLSWTAFVPSGSIAKWDATVVAANTTSLGGDLTFSGISILDPGGLVTIDTGNTLTLGAAPVDIDLSAATQDLTINCNLTMGAANVWDVPSGRTLSLGGAVSGSATVTKQGAGTAVLSGANSYTGTTVVSLGTLNVTGNTTGTGNVTVGNTAGNAVLNLPTGGSLIGTASGTSPTITLGTGGAGSVGALNITGGTVNLQGTETTDGIAFGASNGGYGSLFISSGSFTQQRFMFGGNGSATGTGGVGVGLQTGGTVNSTGWMILGRHGASTGVYTITGGTLNHAGASQDIAVGLNGSGRAELNVAGGLLDNTGRRVDFSGGTGGSFVWTGTGLLNLNAGTLLTNAVFYSSGTAYANFNGGTLKAATTNPSFMNAITTGGAYVNGAFGTFTGGAVIDTNNFNATIAANLLAPTGDGVATIPLTSGGSGYVGAPYVQITGGGGAGATAYSTIDQVTGAVTGIVITNPGIGYTSAPSVTLVGGGGSGAAPGTPTLAANTSGGLTKIGAGTLFLNGANTYTGGTLVSVGALKFPTAVPAATDVSVAGGAEGGVLVGVDNAQWTNTGNLTLQNNGAAVVDYGSTTPSISAAPISVTNFAFGTNPGVRLTANPTSAIQVGQPYPLVTWTGSGPADGPAAFTSLTHRLTGNFSVATNTLYFTATSNLAGSPISWNTGNGLWDTSAANWSDANLASTTYFDTLDAVVFGDASGASGNPSITLGSSVSPVSMTMNSTAHDYTVSGAHSIGGSGALTLDAANTRTFTLATANNSFTGGTTVNGGTLVLGDATNTLLDTGAVTVDGASAILSLGSNIDMVGAVSLKNGASITGSGTLTGTSFALESGNVSANLGGAGALTKTTAGTVILSGDNSATTGATSISGGTLVAANVNALNTTASVGISTTTGSGTLRLATDTSVAAFPLTSSTSNPGTIIVDRATAGPGITHVLGSMILTNNIWTIQAGSNVTSGTAVVSLASGNLSAGAAGTSTFNPTTASVVIPGPVNIGTNNFAKTLALAGDSTGNEISGVVSNGLNTLTVAKSGTSTWTLSGANTYTGATTVSQGKLILSGARTGTSGAISVSNVAGQSAILDITDGIYDLGANAMNIGNAPTTAASGTVNQSGGAISFTSGNAVLVGQNSVGNTGTYNLSGGSITTYASTTRGVMIGVNTATVGNTTGIFNLSGSGVLNMTAASGGGGDAVLQIGRFDAIANDTIAAFNQTGGTANVGILSIGGNGATGTGIASTMSLTGGTFTANQFARLALGNTNSATITIGGSAQVTLPAFPLTHGTGSTATITFDSGASGYLRPSAASGIYMQAATFNEANLTANGAKLDTNGVDITIGQVLQNAPSVAGTLTKSGAGVLTLSGANTYTGNTVVNAGTLELAATGQLKFVLGATGVNNSLTGTDASLKGSFVIDTTAADSLSSGTWLLENITTAVYDGTFTVSGFSPVGTTKWTKPVSGGKSYTFDETTGILELAVAGYASWIDGFFPGETNPLIIGVDADPDNDGIENGVEMVIGGNPATGMDTALLPTIELVNADPDGDTTFADYLLFTYRRSDLSVAGGVTADCETDTDLVAPWTPATGAPGVVILVDNNFAFTPPAAADTDRVRVYVPRGANTKLFARLNVVVP